MTVVGVGPEQVKIMLVGEAPGETEEKEGKPFVGTAGKCLDSMLEEAGIRREECYITNVMQVRPAGNKFSNFYEKVKGKNVPSAALLEGIERLKLEIVQHKPNVIVLLGNEAMKAVLGFEGVVDYRGSVLDSPYGKVIPTIHPASVARNWAFRPAVVCDLMKVRKEAEYPDIRTAKRELVVCYSYEQALEELRRLEHEEEIAFDIETESGQITAIAFSAWPRRAVCIPFWFGETKSIFGQEQELELWKGVRRVLEGAGRKIAHNGLFDIEELSKVGITVANFQFDTMLAAHAVYPELPKGLGFWCSIYTDQTYYKHERVSSDMDSFFRYNATDACITYEIAQELKRELKECKVEEFFYTYMMPLVWPIARLELRGIRYDWEECLAMREVSRKTIASLQAELDGLVGESLNVGSHKQMCDWLYSKKKYKKQFKKDKISGESRLTADDEALESISRGLKEPSKELDIIREIRYYSKLLSTYLTVSVDEDKRMRCSFNLAGTETGRLSSSKTVRGTGSNLQNVPREVKHLFRADPGMVLVEADLSQAEARIVSYLANEVRLIDAFNKGGDVHRQNAARMFNKEEKDVTEAERNLGKRACHALNYGMGPATFSRDAGIPIGEARRVRNSYFACFPRIAVWHLQMASALKKSRTLGTPFGRKRVFYSMWSESVLKEGLAYIPQSTVADIINRAIIMLDRMFLGSDVSLLLQVHDSILLQCPVDKLQATVTAVRECMEKPVLINSKQVSIPAEFKVGDNWGNMKKYKNGDHYAV